MTGAAEDPGPPPARGLVVRHLPEGYYVRIWPQPALPLLRLLGLGVGSAILGTGIGLWFTADEPLLLSTIIIASVVFIELLGLFAYGRSFFPAEISVGPTVINWDGERHALSSVRDCVYLEHRLELRAEQGRVLGMIDHVAPEVGRWVSLAVRASL